MKYLFEKLLLEEDGFEDVENTEEVTDETSDEGGESIDDIFSEIEADTDTTEEESTNTDDSENSDDALDDTSDDSFEEPVEMEPTTTTYKVTFNLGKHNNWSRVDAVDEEDAKQQVTDYVTRKWPDREFEVVSVEEFDETEMEESLNESLENNPMEANKIFVNGEPYITFEKDTPQDEIDKIAYQLKNILGTKEVRVVYEDGSTYNMKVEALAESLGEITDAQPIEDGAAVGMSTVISDLIKNEYETIDQYNAAIATAEAEGFGDMTTVLTEIQAEEHLHIGQLQAILNTLDPNAHLVDDGKQEGIEQLSNPLGDNDIVEESLKEDLDDMSLTDQEMFIRCVNEIWNMSVMEWTQKYYDGLLDITTVDSYDDIPDTSNLIEIGKSDLSQGTGNVIVYTYMNAGDGQLYRYASF